MSHFKQIMRVKAQDARLCLRHAELSLAWGFGSRDGGTGRAREGRLAPSPVPDWLGPRPRHLWPRLPPAHTHCSKHMSGKRSYVSWSCHIIYISVLYKLRPCADLRQSSSAAVHSYRSHASFCSLVSMWMNRSFSCFMFLKDHSPL